jgi:hypothetical protein
MRILTPKVLLGVPIERVSILLGHQSDRIAEKHYAPRVRARQGQLEADVRRTWPEGKPPEEVQTEYTGEPKRTISLVSSTLKTLPHQKTRPTGT